MSPAIGRLVRYGTRRPVDPSPDRLGAALAALAGPAVWLWARARQLRREAGG